MTPTTTVIWQYETNVCKAYNIPMRSKYESQWNTAAAATFCSPALWSSHADEQELANRARLTDNALYGKEYANGAQLTDNAPYGKEYANDANGAWLTDNAPYGKEYANDANGAWLTDNAPYGKELRQRSTTYR